MNDREIFQRNLNYYLESTGKLQRELAEYVGAKYTTVSGWTRGISYPRADAMEKIANFFGIRTSLLISEHTSDSSPLSNDEKRIIHVYRSLGKAGREYLLQQASIASAMFGEKGETDSSSESG